MNQTFHLRSVEDWSQVVTAISSELERVRLIGLTGPLGAGKTTFVQVLSQFLGYSGKAKSPTFALMRWYALDGSRFGFRRLVHIDAYRIESPDDVLTLDLDELLVDPSTLVVIEWPERIEAALKRLQLKRIDVTIEVEGEGRKVELSDRL